MHILFVHQNFPAQFGHIAEHLAHHLGWRSTFLSERPPGQVGSVELIQYQPRGGATAQTHFCSRTFENAIWRTQAVYDALKARPDIQPDLVVGHSGFGSTLFLRELYDAPIVNLFEYFYRPHDSDMDFRPDFPSSEPARLRARARNATILLDLENCTLGYTPTRWQHDRLPRDFDHKLRVIFDGIDTALWKPLPDRPHHLASLDLPDHLKVVTYATRGMESMRGFDIFMKLAKRLCDRRQDVVFVVAGQDRVCYGGDSAFTGGLSFKQWVLSQDHYDLSRFRFVGLLPPAELARLFNRSDLHVYLTVPFVLSWSLLNALACGATVLASDTDPVLEIITHDHNGLLAPFFDLDRMTDLAEQVLDHPNRFRHLGQNGSQMVLDRYSLSVCLPQIISLFEDALDSH